MYPSRFQLPSLARVVVCGTPPIGQAHGQMAEDQSVGLGSAGPRSVGEASEMNLGHGVIRSTGNAPRCCLQTGWNAVLLSLGAQEYSPPQRQPTNGHASCLPSSAAQSDPAPEAANDNEPLGDTDTRPFRNKSRRLNNQRARRAAGKVKAVTTTARLTIAKTVGTERRVHSPAPQVIAPGTFAREALSISSSSPSFHSTAYSEEPASLCTRPSFALCQRRL